MPHNKKKEFIASILKNAKRSPKHIILPEEDDRVLKAASILTRKRIATITLIGNPKKIQQRAKKLKISLRNINIIDMKNPPFDFAKKLAQLRKKKGLTIAKAKKLLQDPMYYATMMLQTQKADGNVSGAAHPTAHTFRPALQIVKTTKGISTASSYFIMLFKDTILFLADCGLDIDPTAEQLADIAHSTALSATQFGVKPKVAMLACSTKGSAHHPIIDKVVNATKIVKKRWPALCIDGELQVDAALVPEVAKQKAPRSPIKGNANVLIFPDLNSGNIGYKLVQRLAHAVAVGPISQGLKKPVNDLSRGCSVEDIVEVVAITVLQAQ